VPKFKRKEDKMKELESKIEELQELIAEKKTELKELEKEIDSFELDPDDYEDGYCNMLDKCYPELFNMQPSRILRECDPTAYRCGLLDYADLLDLSDNSDYCELTNKQSDLETEISDLETELQELEELNENQED
jgi:predicted  nucleic acid-binding Zn-ribbon protein